MDKNRWQLQEAKNHFSEVVEHALKDGPQEVTRRGKDVVVIISFELYQALSNPKKDLVAFFQDSPLKGVELDLERSKEFPRDVDL